MPHALWLSSLRYLLRHPWLALLSVIGVGLGVGVVVSVDLASNSASRAFALSAESVAGNATHQVVGAGEGLDGEVYRVLRADLGMRRSAPVVDGYATETVTGRTFQVLGVDPFAEGPFRAYVSGETVDLAAFMARGMTTMMAAETAQSLGKEAGDTVQVQVEGITEDLQIVRLLEPEDERTRRAVASLLVMDVATAQQLMRTGDRISRIDLILPNDSENIRREIEAALPAGVSIVRSEARTQAVEQMADAFNLNLAALSLLALVVGMFLIYNTMTFAVVQRRQLLGRLRALGVTEGQVFSLVLFEALLIGVVGTIVGLAAGIALAQVLVDLVTRTISDLYFTVTVRELHVGPGRLLMGGLLGVGATMLAALVPAREAARSPVADVMRRSKSESDARKWMPYLAAAGGLCALLSLLVLAWPSRSIVLGYVALCLVLLAAASLTPLLMVLMSRLLQHPLGRAGGAIGRMAARGLERTLSRSAVAVAALAIAVSATIGVGIMVDSFRNTVQLWLDHSLQADVYVQPPDVVFRRATATLTPEAEAKLRSADGVAEAFSIRRIDLRTSAGAAEIAAIEPGERTESVYRLKEARADAWGAFRQGEPVVLVSEPFSYRTGLSTGESLEIQTEAGPVDLTIAGIYFDYASDQGTVLMNRDLYTQFFDDDTVSGLALHAAAGQDVDDLIEQLQQDLAGTQELFIRSNTGLREASMEVFDQTFAVTHVLRLLTIIVAFIGVLSALMALQIERSREMAVLRANGMTPGQTGSYVTLQTGLMGLVAGILSLPLGVALAAILTFAINRRSFGWTMQFQISPELLVQAIVLAVGAALVAAAYPAWMQSRTRPADALKQE